MKAKSSIKHLLKILFITGFSFLSNSIFSNSDSAILFQIFDMHLNNININSPLSNNPKVHLVDIDLSSNHKACDISLTRIIYKKEVATKPFQIYLYRDHYFLISFKEQLNENKSFTFNKNTDLSKSIPIDSVLNRLEDHDEDYTGDLFITYIDHFTIKKYRIIHTISNRTYFPSSLCPDKYQVERVYKPLLSEASRNFLIKTNFYTPKKLREINRKHIKLIRNRRLGAISQPPPQLK